MLYRVLADTVVLAHLGWIVFLIFGAVLGVRYKAAKVVHVVALAFSVLLQAGGWFCPLTYLEVWLRGRHEASTVYPGSFIAHYAEQLVYLEITRLWVFGATVLVIGITAWLYLRKPRTDVV